MIVEQGTVVEIEDNRLWVETVQKSACDSCGARSGCGQRVLSRLSGNRMRIPVLLPNSDASAYAVGQLVTIGIDDHVVVRASLMVYLWPLVWMLAGSALLAQWGDIASIAGALAGLGLGALLVARKSKKSRNDCSRNPVIIDGREQHLPL